MRKTILIFAIAASAAAAHAQPIIERKGNTACPDGYQSSGSGCVGFHRDTPAAIRRQDGKSCPSGTYASGDYCKAFR